MPLFSISLYAVFICNCQYLSVAICAFTTFTRKFVSAYSLKGGVRDAC